MALLTVFAFNISGLGSEKLIAWILYEVILPLMPVGLVYLGSSFFRNTRIFEIIRDGQLCFYCTTLVAILLRDLAKKNTPTNGLLNPVLIILIIFATFIYAAAVLDPAKTGDEKKIGWTSICTCITTLSLVLSVRTHYDLF